MIAAPKPGDLPVRLRETADLVADGWSNHEIASRLSVAEVTIRNRLQRIYDLLDMERFADSGAINQRIMLARWIWQHSRD